MNSVFAPKRVMALWAAAIFLMIFAIGCSDSTEPETGGGGGTPYADVPPIPEPENPGGETGAISDTVTVIAPLKTNYRPMVKSAFAGWSIQVRCCEKQLPFIDSCDDWAQLIGMLPTWSDSLPPLSYDRCGEPMMQSGVASIARPDPWYRILLMEDGEILQPAAGESGVETIWEFELLGHKLSAQCQLGWQTYPIDEGPYLRRDRFWVRQPLQDVGNFLILIGDVEGSISTTRTWGSSVTETEEFGKSVTVSAGLGFGALSLGVETTLSHTFSTAVTISEETSETFSQTVKGEDGKTVHYQVWQLVEFFTITDANGDPFTDPNYKVELSTFTIRNGALALVATKFDS